MSTLYRIPLKRTSNIDVTKPIKNVLKSSASVPLDRLDGILKEFQALRVGAIKVCTSGGDPTLNAISSYYDQLSSLERKIPIHEVQISFKYKDAFDRGSLFGGRVSLSVTSLLFEKVGTLFNLAALHSNFAADQNLLTDDGLQAALKKLQIAGGIFQFLKDNVVGMIQQDPTPDLDPDTLDLMLAEAQEVVVTKAVNGSMKNATLAKLCKECDELYRSVLDNISKPPKDGSRMVWDQNLIYSVGAKQALYVGLAHYYMGKVAHENKQVGQEIARMKTAELLMKEAVTRACSVGGRLEANSKRYLGNVQRELSQAQKDNDFIYHERVPESDSLEPISKFAVAKLVPFQHEARFAPNDKDLFAELTPVVIQHALNTFEGRKREKAVNEIRKLKSETELLNDLLSSMNLPACIESTTGNELPQSLIEKSSTVVAEGGMDIIVKQMQELPELLKMNTEILDECDRMLEEEEKADSQLREQFKEKWTRTPSVKLTAAFKENIRKYRALIVNATKADAHVKSKLDTHTEGIEYLSKGPTSLKSIIPSSNSMATRLDNPAVGKLRALMKEVDALKTEREEIEEAVKNPNIEMKAIFEQAFKNHGSIDEANLSSSSLKNTFEPYDKKIAENLSKQEKLVVNIQQGYEMLISEKGQSDQQPREEMLKKLAAAYDGFKSLNENLREGTKFYNHLTGLLVSVQSKISDFCFARKTEKEELLKDLVSGIASMDINSSSAPTVPVHPGETPERPPRKADPPARPPPPQISGEAAPVNTYTPPVQQPQLTQAPYPPSTHQQQPVQAPYPPSAHQQQPTQAPYYQPTPFLPYPVQPGGGAYFNMMPNPYYMPPPQGYYPTYPSYAAPQSGIPHQPYPYPPQNPPPPQQQPPTQ